MNDIFNTTLTKVTEIISVFGLKLLSALVFLIIGGFLIKQIKKFLQKILKNKDIDGAISSFCISLLNTALWILVILAALSQIGVQTTSFIAVIGAAGLAIGLALQGSLSNFASGFLIILFRPFKVGDVIDVSDNIGFVNSITMLQHCQHFF